MKTFKAAVKEYMVTLEQYVPVVARVHGTDHSEFYEVQEIFNNISNKINSNELNEIDLNDEFSHLRKVTNNYTVPKDTCESFEAVYKMLSELDKSYSK